MTKTTFYRIVVKKRQQRSKIYTYPVGKLLFDVDDAIKIVDSTTSAFIPYGGIDKSGNKIKSIIYPASSLSTADYYVRKADISVNDKWQATVAAYPINVENNHYEYRTVSIHDFCNTFVISIATTDIAVLNSLDEALMFIDWFMM